MSKTESVHAKNSVYLRNKDVGRHPKKLQCVVYSFCFLEILYIIILRSYCTYQYDDQLIDHIIS
jgi:hypothetical protein